MKLVSQRNHVRIYVRYFRWFKYHFKRTSVIQLPEFRWTSKGLVHRWSHRPNPCVEASRVPEETRVAKVRVLKTKIAIHYEGITSNTVEGNNLCSFLELLETHRIKYNIRTKTRTLNTRYRRRYIYLPLYFTR